MLFYSSLLIPMTKIAGVVLYDFATLDTAMSWIITFGIGIVFSVVHLLFARLSESRLKSSYDLEVNVGHKAVDGLFLIILPDEN